MQRIELPDGVQRIIGRLESAGFEAYAVGGCVRDSLLGRTPEDWDITSSARPEELKRLFKRTVDTGIQHGTVTVLIGGGEGGGRAQAFEVTSYRVDGEYKDGRHPESVRFTPSLSEDLSRRDFTINAMAYNEKSGIVDLFRGMEDLERGEIRAVGEAELRFREDALRMLRALRFSAQLRFRIAPRTLDAVRSLARGLSKVSKERIQAELTKLLLSDSPEQMELVFQTGLAPYVSEHFPEIASPSLPELSGDMEREAFLRWGMLLRGREQLAKRILRELKMDRATIDRAGSIAALHGERIPEDAPGARRLLSRYGRELFFSWLSMEEALALHFPRERAEKEKGDEREERKREALPGREASLPGERRQGKIRRARALGEEILKNGDCLSLSALMINGEDLAELGIPRGPEYSAVLRTLLSEVLEDPKRNRREYLRKRVKEIRGLVH